ncbi:hypothetical protein FACS189476_06750 [Spirochaetia bacterium]|nr:hypothetical protein FACS189476_06750 [Spirochaetia bacterium]
MQNKEKDFSITVTGRKYAKNNSTQYNQVSAIYRISASNKSEADSIATCRFQAEHPDAIEITIS